MRFEIVAAYPNHTCHECDRAFGIREPCMVVWLDKRHDGSSTGQRHCFECFMELPDEMARARAEFATECEVYEMARIRAGQEVKS